MISASKLAALRLSLQPLTCFSATAQSVFPGPAPTPAPYTPGSLSSSELQQHQQQSQVPFPQRVRLSPVPDATLCSPTPTRAAFLLTPTRFVLSPVAPPTEAELESPFITNLEMDPRSPMLSTCVCEGCDNLVSSARNTCSQCKEVFLDLLSKQGLSVAQKHIRSPVQLANRRTSGGPLSPRWSGTLNPKSPQLSEKTFHSIALSAPAEERHFDNTYKYNHSCATKDSLSVAHPRPCPIETGRSTDRSNQDKLTRKMRESDMDLEEVGSPDALYFGKRSRRSYAYTNRSRRQVEPCITSLKTSSRIQKVEDEDMSP